jgi:NAD(P)H dehydrogenase (quinone)
MNILVIYHSRTGRTKALAEEVARGVRDVDEATCIVKDAVDVSTEDFAASDGIIAGSPVYFGTMAAELKAVFDRCVVVRKRMGGKVGAAFATAGFHTGGKETTMMSILQAMLIYGMIVVGDPLTATGHYGAACTGTPDGEAARTARSLGRRVAMLAKTLKAASPGDAL